MIRATAPDLVHRGWYTPTSVDELWVADFSYVWTLTGFVCVAFVVPAFPWPDPGLASLHLDDGHSPALLHRAPAPS